MNQATVHSSLVKKEGIEMSIARGCVKSAHFIRGLRLFQVVLIGCAFIAPTVNAREFNTSSPTILCKQKGDFNNSQPQLLEIQFDDFSSGSGKGKVVWKHYESVQSFDVEIRHLPGKLTFIGSPYFDSPYLHFTDNNDPGREFYLWLCDDLVRGGPAQGKTAGRLKSMYGREGLLQYPFQCSLKALAEFNEKNNIRCPKNLVVELEY